MRILCHTVGELAENSYLVVDDVTNTSVIVDPGAEPETLIGMIHESGSTLAAIWLTHAHVDHIGAVQGVHDRFPVDVYLHPLDLPWYEHLSAQSALVFGIPFLQPTVSTLPIADSDILKCGSLDFKVMHVPGHAPGHVAYVCGDTALSGDLVFAGSIGRTDLPLCNPHDMDASLRRFAALPSSTIVYPGHGDPTDLAAELADNPFLNGAARTLKLR